MTLSYISVDINTGAIIADLPDLIMQGAMPQTLMRYETQTALIPLDSAPENWRTATRDYSAVIICLADDTVTPLWGGVIAERTTNEGPNVTLSLATMEAYMDRRYVGDHAFTATDQNSIVTSLVNAHMGGPNGVPVRVQVVGPAGTARDRTYLDTDDKTLYSCLSDLSGVIGGPEWTIGWEVNNNLYTPVLYVGNRIGAAVTAGLGANAVFDMPGPVTKAQLVESYTSGNGANDVMATSSGSAGARPQSAHQTPDTGFNGRPKVENRFSPSTSITDVNTLTAHAQRALAAVQDGTSALTISAARQEAPVLGKDWHIGDDVGFDLTSKAWPEGLTGTTRTIGWQLDDNTISPILVASSLGGLGSTATAAPVEGTSYPHIYPGADIYPSLTTYPA